MVCSANWQGSEIIVSILLLTLKQRKDVYNRMEQGQMSLVGNPHFCVKTLGTSPLQVLSSSELGIFEIASGPFLHFLRWFPSKMGVDSPQASEEDTDGGHPSCDPISRLSLWHPIYMEICNPKYWSLTF